MHDRTAYRIERGGVERRIYGAKTKAVREAHTLVVQTLVDVPTTLPAQHRDWAFDLRRGRLNIYGSLLRFIDTLRARNVPIEKALLIPAWLESYVREIYSDVPAEGVIRKVG